MTVELRIAAEDLVRTGDDEGLLVLVPQLRDDEQWVAMWAPACAVAAWRLGRPEARDYLLEALDGGFFQPELFEGEIEEAFRDEPDWPQLADKIAANLPSAPLELIAWPALSPKLPLELYRAAPDREELLRGLLPDLSGSAWQTALGLLHWVTDRWEHANDHVKGDAVEVLRQVDEEGKRFACVEYSIVLSHALNAVGIPARRLELRQRDHHAGYGKGHVVSEAWIDDFGAWVVLDGQCGCYWSFGAEPLSTLEVQRSLADRRQPHMLAAGGPKPTAEAAWWWTYFQNITTTGATWAQPTFVPHFQYEIQPSQLLVRSADDVYPDLAEVGISIDVRDGAAALRFVSRHPFVTGYAVQLGERRWAVGAADPVWLLPATPGSHTATVSVRTKFGELAPQRLIFRVTA